MASLVALGSLLLARPVRADGASDKQACVSAHSQGQKLRRAGRTHEARARFVSCASAACPAVVRQECVGFLQEVNAELPSIIVEVRDASGQDVTAVSVLVDGEVVADRLTGLPLEIDPGEHELRVMSADGSSVTQALTVRLGERNRRVTVSIPSLGVDRALHGPPTAPAGIASAPARPVPPLFYALGGLGVAGVGVGTAMGIVALSQADDLESSPCAARRDCASADVSAMRRNGAVADVGFAFGVAAMAAALVVYFTRPTAAAPRAAFSLPTHP